MGSVPVPVASLVVEELGEEGCRLVDAWPQYRDGGRGRREGGEVAGEWGQGWWGRRERRRLAQSPTALRGCMDKSFAAKKKERKKKNRAQIVRKQWCRAFAFPGHLHGECSVWTLKACV